MITVGYRIWPSGVQPQLKYVVLQSATGTTGQIKVWDSLAWVAKPIKMWNGTSWSTKPLKRWDGSAWTVTPY